MNQNTRQTQILRSYALEIEPGAATLATEYAAVYRISSAQNHYLSHQSARRRNGGAQPKIMAVGRCENRLIWKGSAGFSSVPVQEKSYLIRSLLPLCMWLGRSYGAFITDLHLLFNRDVYFSKLLFLFVTIA